MLSGTIRAPGFWQETLMPEKKTLERARSDARKGKAPSSQAGEFVRQEIEHIREGKPGARFRKAGDRHRTVEGPTTSEITPKQAVRSYAQEQKATRQATSPTGSRAVETALKREGRQAASHTAHTALS